MNDQKHKDALRAVVCRVLEQAAFIFTDESADTPKIDPYATPFVKVSLDFTGAHSGRMMLILPIDVCGEFAVNMLGCDPADCASKESQIDAGREIANMVTGQLLTELYGNQAVINLSAPESVDLQPDEFFATLDANEYICTMVEDRPVIAIFSEIGTLHEHQSTGC
jgi:CheY-specific phosphatase CheX